MGEDVLYGQVDGLNKVVGYEPTGKVMPGR